MLYFNQFKWLLYALYLTNYYGFKLKKTFDPSEKKRIRLAYAQKLLSKLQISVNVEESQKLPERGQYLLLCNHRSIIDPLIVEIALADTGIFGLWIAKKELYNSSFFGLFVRNGGTILLDRSQKQMGGFFTDIKAAVKEGSSIFIFPEGTRNKTDADLMNFKEGSRIIALKNRLPVLPVYIKTDAGKVLKKAINGFGKEQEITIIVGDLIDYRSKEELEDAYRKMFNLSLAQTKLSK